MKKTIKKNKKNVGDQIRTLPKSTIRRFPFYEYPRRFPTSNIFQDGGLQLDYLKSEINTCHFTC